MYRYHMFLSESIIFCGRWAQCGRLSFFLQTLHCFRIGGGATSIHPRWSPLPDLFQGLEVGVGYLALWLVVAPHQTTDRAELPPRPPSRWRRLGFCPKVLLHHPIRSAGLLEQDAGQRSGLEPLGNGARLSTALLLAGTATAASSASSSLSGSSTTSSGASMRVAARYSSASTPSPSSPPAVVDLRALSRRLCFLARELERREDDVPGIL